MEAGKHPRESERLKELWSYDVLDSERESEFDEIVDLAASICGTPIALISLVDEQRQWFKAETGLGVRETPLGSSICAHVILEDDFVEIPDTLEDPRTTDNILCMSDPGLRFYAGAQLKGPGGLPVGTLCVLDHKPRRLSDQQQMSLKLLARQAMTQLQSRRALKRESKARRDLEIVSEHVPVMIVRVDAERRYLFVNARYAAYFGRTMDEMIGEHPRDVLGQEVYETVGPMMDRAFAGETFDYDLEIRDSEDGRRVLNVAYAPELDDEGRIVGVIAAIDDVTERRGIEHAIAQSASRLRRILDGLLSFVGMLQPDGTLTEANATAIGAAGLERDDVIGKPFWDTYWWSHSVEVQDRLRDAIRRAAAGETVRYDEDVRVAGGELITIDFQLVPVTDSTGAVVEIIPSAIDITARQAAEDHRALLMGELKHRVKNSLVTVQAIAAQTARNSSGIDEFLDTFQGRLGAIARAHDILSVEDGTQGKLRDLFAEQVGPYAQAGTGECRLTGPEIMLGGDAAHALGLVLHELATNAAKYGALSREGGAIDLSWRIENGERRVLVIDWVESGGPPVAKPDHEGFGSRLIEASLVRGLKGEAALRYDPDGFKATLTVPL